MFAFPQQREREQAQASERERASTMVPCHWSLRLSVRARYTPRPAAHRQQSSSCLGVNSHTSTGLGRAAEQQQSGPPTPSPIRGGPPPRRSRASPPTPEPRRPGGADASACHLRRPQTSNSYPSHPEQADGPVPDCSPSRRIFGVITWCTAPDIEGYTPWQPISQ